MKLFPPSLPRSSYVPSSFGLYCNACFGSLFVSILCTCCSHFFWYCFISFTMFCAPVFCLMHLFFSLSNKHFFNNLNSFVYDVCHLLTCFRSCPKFFTRRRCPEAKPSSSSTHKFEFVVILITYFESSCRR
jgi:hypothetical protein